MPHLWYDCSQRIFKTRLWNQEEHLHLEDLGTIPYSFQDFLLLYQRRFASGNPSQSRHFPVTNRSISSRCQRQWHCKVHKLTSNMSTQTEMDLLKAPRRKHFPYEQAHQSDVGCGKAEWTHELLFFLPLCSPWHQLYNCNHEKPTKSFETIIFFC